MDGLEETYSKLTNNELLIIVYFESSRYTEEAIKVAKSILKKRGLDQPSNEILQQAKNDYSQLKASQKDQFAETIQSGNIFRFGKLKQAFKEKNYYFIGKWLFWFIVGFGFYSGLSGRGKLVELISLAGTIKPEWQIILEVVFNITILGIFPVIFFIIYSLKLSPKQRKEQRLSLLMPKSIFFVYGISLFLFLFFVILPR